MSISFQALPGEAFRSIQESSKLKTGKDAKVEVYYFHFTKRCATCNAVETETIKALEKLYPEKVKNGEIVFLAVNLDEEEGEEIAETLGINSQCLLFVSGDNKIDLTTKAFMNARSNPGKLHEEISGALQELGV